MKRFSVKNSYNHIIVYADDKQKSEELFTRYISEYGGGNGDLSITEVDANFESRQLGLRQWVGEYCLVSYGDNKWLLRKGIGRNVEIKVGPSGIVNLDMMADYLYEVDISLDDIYSIDDTAMMSRYGVVLYDDRTVLTFDAEDDVILWRMTQ